MHSTTMHLIHKVAYARCKMFLVEQIFKKLHPPLRSERGKQSGSVCCAAVSVNAFSNKD